MAGPAEGARGAGAGLDRSASGAGGAGRAASRLRFSVHLLLLSPGLAAALASRPRRRAGRRRGARISALVRLSGSARRRGARSGGAAAATPRVYRVAPVAARGRASAAAVLRLP